MAAPGRIRVGTSGWIYKHWRGVVYPQSLPIRQWFSQYTNLFDTVEINNSFYRLPSEEAFDTWARQAPPGFIYAIKASRFLTHMKKLKDAAQPLELILGRARRLGEHLGPILYQLPPHWHRDVTRLRSFLKLLPADLCHVLEFRDPSWYNEEVHDALAEHKVCFCMHDLGGIECPSWITAPVIYIRFHGPSAQHYAGSYSHSHLRRWAQRIRDYGQTGHDVFVFFNNDIGGHAVTNALELRSLLEEGVEQAPAGCERSCPD